MAAMLSRKLFLWVWFRCVDPVDSQGETKVEGLLCSIADSACAMVLLLPGLYGSEKGTGTVSSGTFLLVKQII